MRVLWLSNETPDRTGQGGQRRQYFQIRALVRDGHDVTVATLAGPQSESTLSAHASVHRLSPRIAGRFPNPYAISKLRRSLGDGWDRVVVAHAESWPLWSRYARWAGAPVLVDLHNVLSASHFAEGRGDESLSWRRVELAILREADAVTVCSERERERLKAPRRTSVVVMPHGIDPEEWQESPAPAATPVIKLFGNWAWPPNAAGLSWFIDQVLSRSELPFRCEIAGSRAPSTAVPGLVRVGRVPSIPHFLADAHVIGVPVCRGVGAPVKYIEALSSGVPVIATRDGASLERPGLAVISDDPDQWVRFLGEVLEHPEEFRSRAAAVRAVAMSELDWDSSAQPLRRWVRTGRTE